MYLRAPSDDYLSTGWSSPTPKYHTTCRKILGLVNRNVRIKRTRAEIKFEVRNIRPIFRSYIFQEGARFFWHTIFRALLSSDRFHRLFFVLLRGQLIGFIIAETNWWEISRGLPTNMRDCEEHWDNYERNREKCWRKGFRYFNLKTEIQP